MKYIAINTAGIDTEILIKYEDKKVFWRGDGKYRTSEILLPQLDLMLEKLNLSLEDFDCFGTVIGPGSFTGIRVGVATVKGFCYSLNKPCIALNHLFVMANGVEISDETVVSIIDGSNGTCYIGVYENRLEHVVLEPRCMKIEDVSRFIDLIDEQHTVIVDKSLEDTFGCGIKPENSALEKAMDFQVLKNNFLDYNKIEPLYIRVSQAERGKDDL